MVRLEVRLEQFEILGVVRKKPAHSLAPVVGTLHGAPRGDPHDVHLHPAGGDDAKS